MFTESWKRAITKTLSWRMIATLTTTLIVYMLVGRFDIAVLAGGIEMIAKMLLYYFHERIWNNIQIGKKQNKPFVLWFTGLSGSGKSTISEEVYKYLKKKSYKVEHLDGDTVRSIFPSIGFSKDDRNNHIRRIGYLASILEKNGIIVIASFVSPYKESRDFVRNITNNFVEVHVSTSLEACESRDVKGLYKKARAGEIKNFTGIDDPYEVPENPEIIVETETKEVDSAVRYVLKEINKFL